jgi:hypothetical protein
MQTLLLKCYGHFCFQNSMEGLDRTYKALFQRAEVMVWGHPSNFDLRALRTISMNWIQDFENKPRSLKSIIECNSDKIENFPCLKKK